MRRQNLTLHLEYHNGHERWRQSDGKRIDNDVAQRLNSPTSLPAMMRCFPAPSSKPIGHEMCSINSRILKYDDTNIGDQ
jgi:hypothetical protein